MGEAKRRRAAAGSSLCKCGSQRAGQECCFDGRKWHKRPAALGLKTLPKTGTVEKCYMKELNSCFGGISGEHLISEGIIHVLADGGDFSIGGLPWLSEGEFKVIGPKNLTAKCLCCKHNSMLHRLDDAGLAFFSTLKSCLDRKAQNVDFLVSGHDIERWLLKTVKAMAASGNLARGQARLPGAFSSDVSVIEMLDDVKKWPQKAGLYCVLRRGEVIQNHNRFRMAPVTNADDEVIGMAVEIMGLQFSVVLDPDDPAFKGMFAGAVYRPGQIRITVGSSINYITFSWDDGRRHRDALMMEAL